MQIVGSTTVGVAIAAFLKAEFDSPTESRRLRAVLQRMGIGERIVTTPDLEDHGEIEHRSAVFERYRGREALFETLDLHRLAWVEARLSADDLRFRVLTCRHHFEDEYGTRNPEEIARIRNSRGSANGVVERLCNGEVLEPPLLVGTEALDRFVILEGHNRVISCLRDLSAVALPLRVLIGHAETVSTWREWPER